VLEKAKEEARRLAALARKRPTLPSLDNIDPNLRPHERQNYRDPKGPKPLRAVSPTAPFPEQPSTAPLVAGNADLAGQIAGNHQSASEAAWAGAIAADIAV